VQSGYRPNDTVFDFCQKTLSERCIEDTALSDLEKGRVMPTTEPNAGETIQNPERVPMMQRVLDNPFLLLFLGVTLPTVLYLIWGIMEVASVPLAK